MKELIEDLTPHIEETAKAAAKLLSVLKESDDPSVILDAIERYRLTVEDNAEHIDNIEQAIRTKGGR